MAHFAVSDIARRQFKVSERFARDALGPGRRAGRPVPCVARRLVAWRRRREKPRRALPLAPTPLRAGDTGYAGRTGATSVATDDVASESLRQRLLRRPHPHAVVPHHAERQRRPQPESRWCGRGELLLLDPAHDRARQAVPRWPGARCQRRRAGSIASGAAVRSAAISKGGLVRTSTRRRQRADVLRTPQTRWRARCAQRRHLART